MATLAPSFLIESSSFLQVNMHKCLNEFEFLPDPNIDSRVIDP